MQIKEQLGKYLQGETKILTTPCNVIELESLGPKFYGPCLIMKQFPVHQCGHSKKRLGGSSCVLSMVKDKEQEKRYIVATQDRELTNSLREIGGIPVLYLHESVPVLEGPSKESLAIAEKGDVKDAKLSSQEKKVLKEAKKDFGIEDSIVTKKRRKRKGPNPLSCLPPKKKKLETNSSPQKDPSNTSQKRKKPKIKIAKHVREHLAELKSQQA